MGTELNLFLEEVELLLLVDMLAEGLEMAIQVDMVIKEERREARPIMRREKMEMFSREETKEALIVMRKEKVDMKDR